MKAKHWIAAYLINLTWISSSHAGLPMWTFTPDPNYPSNIAIGSAGSGVVKFVVTNNSSKPHQLVIQPMEGIKQTEPCILAPKGTCNLILAVNGRDLPAEGINEGPSVCEIDTHGAPNPYQCYQPNYEDRLNITTTNLPAIDATPDAGLSFKFGGAAQALTIQNLSKTSVIENVNITITPAQSNLSGISIDCDGTSCPSTCSSSISSSLRPLQSCVLSLKPIPVADEPSSNTSAIVEVSGSNATAKDSVHIQVLLNPTQLSVESPGIAIIPYNTNDTSLNKITIKNNGAFPAYNVHALLPSTDFADVIQDASQCSKILPGASCTLSFTSTKPYLASNNILILGDNVDNSVTATLAFSFRDETNDSDYLVFKVDPSSSKVWIVDNKDSATNVLFADAYGTNGVETGVCKQQNKSDLNWTVPYICDMGPNNASGDAGDINCTSNNPNIANNLFSLNLLKQDIGNIKTLNGSYWSNTPTPKSGYGPAAYYQNYNPTAVPPYSQAFAETANGLNNVRCVSEK